MNTPLVFGILVDIGIAITGIYLINKLQKRQTRQPALSKKIIKSLKF